MFGGFYQKQTLRKGFGATFKKIFIIEGQLTYNVILVSGV